MLTPLAVLGLNAFIAAAPVSAAGATTINQTIINAARTDVANAHPEEHEHMTCYNGAPNYCVLDAGDYVVDGDLDFSNFALRLDNNITIDFGGHSITTDFGWSGGANAATVDVRDAANVTLKNGTITSDSDSVRALTTKNAAATSNLVLNGITFPGNNDPSDHHPIELGAGTVTMTNVTSSVANDISAKNTKLTINSGSYGTLNIDDSEVTINGGTFTGNAGGSALYVDMAATGDGTTLTVNGGTFTSAEDNGIEFGGYKSVSLNGGTFSGKESGITLMFNSNLTISGGTFKSSNGHAIRAFGATNASVFDNMLAANHSYTNATTNSGAGFISLGGTETSVVAGTATTAEEASLNAPKSGFMTSDAGSASASLAPAAIIALGGVTAFALAKAKKED